MEASLIPVEYIEQVWPSVEKYLDGAAKYTYGRFTVEDIKYNLLTKPQQLWIAFEDGKVYGAVVSEIINYPRMNALCVHFLGGEKFPRWGKQTLSLVQRFARDSYCSIIESSGRIGWEKVWKNEGYTPRFVFYELPVGVEE